MKTEDIFNANSYTSKAMPIVHLIINKNVINGVTVTSQVQVIGTEKPLDELTAEFVKQFICKRLRISIRQWRLTKPDIHRELRAKFVRSSYKISPDEFRRAFGEQANRQICLLELMPIFER